MNAALNETAIERAIRLLGGPAKTARLFGITPQAICKWDRVPVDRCIDIEKLTKGAVTCEELRPDIDWAYLRNTQQAAA